MIGRRKFLPPNAALERPLAALAAAARVVLGASAAAAEPPDRWTRETHEPRDLCWTQQGRPEQFPLSVIEWKALNRKDTLADLKRKRSEAKGRDADWLKWFTRQADGREGFSVVSDLTRSDFALSAWRCAAGSDLEPVFIFNGGADGV